MVEKFISIYGNLAAQTPFNSDKLVVEISNTHLITWVQQAGANDITNAFEWYTYNATETTWYDIFVAIRGMSKILDRGYIDTRIFYNFPETVLIPGETTEIEAANLFLQAVHGDTFADVVKTDAVKISPSVINAYRISQQLNDMVNGNMIMINARHSHSIIAERLLSRSGTARQTFAKIQFYNKFFILALIKNGHLLLIQSYEMNSPEDVLFHLLNAAQQFQIDITHITLELSGPIDLKGWLYEHLKKVFGNILFDTLPDEVHLPKDFEQFPNYYFTPFFSLLS